MANASDMCVHVSETVLLMYCQVWFFRFSGSV